MTFYSLRHTYASLMACEPPDPRTGCRRPAGGCRNKEAAAALSGDHGESRTSERREKTDMNALIREATSFREAPPGADMYAMLRSAEVGRRLGKRRANRTGASTKRWALAAGARQSAGLPTG